MKRLSGGEIRIKTSLLFKCHLKSRLTRKKKFLRKGRESNFNESLFHCIRFSFGVFIREAIIYAKEVSYSGYNYGAAVLQKVGTFPK